MMGLFAYGLALDLGSGCSICALCLGSKCSIEIPYLFLNYMITFWIENLKFDWN